jgi:hypothetical protein
MFGRIYFNPKRAKVGSGYANSSDRPNRERNARRCGPSWQPTILNTPDLHLPSLSPSNTTNSSQVVIGQLTLKHIVHGNVDATELKLRFWRFLCFARLSKSRAVRMGKSPEFANFFCLSEREQEWAHSCTNSCTLTARTTSTGSRSQPRRFLPKGSSTA